MDRAEALKWHLIAKTAGKGDIQLDEKFANLSPEERAKGEKAAKLWLGTVALPNTAPNVVQSPLAPAATTATK
jgi:hypothetical protein